jgi:hypothetical protein
MIFRLRYWLPGLGLAATIGIVTMLIVTTTAGPLALYLADAAGAHTTGRVLTPAVVRELGRYCGLATFLGCLGIAIDTAKPRHRDRW